jgi:hypothetical protein
MEDKVKEIAAYVREHVEDYERRLSFALGRIDHMRCPFWMADQSLYDEIVSAIEEWCDDNEVDCSEVDWDEVIDGYDGIIWED